MFIFFRELSVLMIRVPVLFIFLCFLAGAALADGMNTTNNTTHMGDQNLTTLEFDVNSTGALNLTAAGDRNLTNTTSGENLTSTDQGVAKEKTPEKPVYTQSIGSVYDADYKEPEARTFTSSACGA